MYTFGTLFFSFYVIDKIVEDGAKIKIGIVHENNERKSQ